MTNIYCSEIHGGLHLVFLPNSDSPMIQHCCLRNDLWPAQQEGNFWNDLKFQPLRLKQEWDPGCLQCKRIEDSGNQSLRTGMNEGLKIYPSTNLSGPARIDLKFDKSCNLACRTCGTWSSTYWQKYLQQSVTPGRSKEIVIAALKRLDLSNLRMLVFCGGETLLGQEYWDVASWLGDNVPNAKQQLTLCFQTNGTQPIHPRNYNIIEKFFLVKLHFSLDGTASKFEYLRWPASWSQVIDNILNIRDTVPSNVMFLVEETISIFNLAYITELDTWVKQNFTTNREGDPVNHTRHMAKGLFRLDNCSQEYVDWASNQTAKTFINKHWKESPVEIIAMLKEIAKHDQMRQQQFSLVFPELAKFYARFL